MNLPYIQSEIFRELVGLETLLKPEYAVTIVRERDKNLMYVEVEYSSEVMHPPGSPRILYKTHIFARSLKTASDITAVINRIWLEIPAECKKVQK